MKRLGRTLLAAAALTIGGCGTLVESEPLLEYSSTISPAPATVGEPVTHTVSLFNVSDFTLRYTLVENRVVRLNDGVEVASDSTTLSPGVEIEPGGEAQESFTHTPEETGSYEFTMMIDGVVTVRDTAQVQPPADNL